MAWTALCGRACASGVPSPGGPRQRAPHASGASATGVFMSLLLCFSVTVRAQLSCGVKVPRTIAVVCGGRPLVSRGRWWPMPCPATSLSRRPTSPEVQAGGVCVPRMGDWPLHGPTPAGCLSARSRAGGRRPFHSSRIWLLSVKSGLSSDSLPSPSSPRPARGGDSGRPSSALQRQPVPRERGK